MSKKKFPHYFYIDPSHDVNSLTDWLLDNAGTADADWNFDVVHTGYIKIGVQDDMAAVQFKLAFQEILS